MTTDMMQNKQIEKKQNTISGDILNFFKKEPAQPIIKRRDTTELLKVAYKMLSQAERKIEEKDRLIRALENITTIDELTGLTNRRGFYQSFKREVDLTNRGNNKGGLLIMIDLDYFKQINDKFGHLAGDEALKNVGNFLQNTVRNMDVAARIGGDEFIVLFPNTNISKSMKRAKKLEKDLNALSFEWNKETINIQGSLGLKEYKQGDTIESIVETADNNMYENKAQKA